MKFKSIQSKLLAIIISGLFLMATTLAVLSISITHQILHTDADSILSAQCETEATKINDALDSIEHSVSIMRHYATTELYGDLSNITQEEKQGPYLEKMDTMFREIAFNTPEATHYYIRLSHELTSSATGFYYAIDSTTKKAIPLENTDLSKFSPDDVANVGWYYLPKEAGEPIWLAPYQQTHNSVPIISYVAPYYMAEGTTKTFLGIIGIDVPYSFLKDKVASISVHDNGSATLSETKPTLHAHSHHHTSDKTAATYQPLNNGMYLVVKAKYADIQRESRVMLFVIAAVATGISLIFIGITLYATKKIIKPLKELAHSANEFAEGNYDVDLEYDGEDEIATMATSLKFAAAKLKDYMSHVNALAFNDALTGVRSNAAFNQATADLNFLLENVHQDFAIVVADVNYLKQANDTYGHAVGNQLIIAMANVLTEIFQHSNVYRVGGDEFVVLLDGEDYEIRHELLSQLEERSTKLTILTKDGEELPVSFAFGMATYTKELDAGVDDVLKHADSAMYLHKRTLKRSQLQSNTNEA